MAQRAWEYQQRRPPPEMKGSMSNDPLLASPLMTTSRCTLCGRFKHGDGILFCPRCRSTRQLKQSVAVTMTSPPIAVMRPDGTVLTVPGYGVTKIKASLRRSPHTRPVVVATVADTRRNYDRNADEICTILVNRAANDYRQRWTDPETGRTTWQKRGLLQDPALHGPASHRPAEDQKGS